VKVALLLGGKGFVGRHMARQLSDNFNVVAVGKEVDARNKDMIHSIIRKIKPDVVINFAFITTVRETFLDPYNTYDTGFTGMLHLLEALKSINFNGRVLNVSSSEVYGFASDSDLPLREVSRLQPMSPYSVAKVAVDNLCFQWCRSEGMDIVTARPFTHIGPGQTDRFALSNFAKQLAQMQLGFKDLVMNVGNLKNTRDITDVRDVVRAYQLLIELGDIGATYNVCSGREVGINQLLNKMIKLTDLDVTITVEKSLARSAEQNRILGSFSKLEEKTGWNPEIPMDKTLVDMIDYWKGKLG